MKVLNLKQNSPDWYQWREGGIGASDCPIILSESPFKKPFRLWLEKTHRIEPEPTKMAQAHGIASEETARDQLCQELGVELEPVSVMDDETPYLRASYDGYSKKNNLIAEIKCPMSPKDHRRAKEGDVPWYYRLQMYQQLYIARAEEMIYYSWFKGEGVRLLVKFDEEFWNMTALPAIQEFWRRVQENEWPLPNGETEHADDPELRQAVMDWFQAQKMKETAEYCGRIAEAVFIRHAGEAKNFISGNIQCQQQVWRPKYRVVIECESEKVQEAVLQACTPLEEQIGAQVNAVTFEPKIVYRFTEIT